jgi:hypothetical protein
VAVQSIKSLARGPWGITPQNRNTWYQPLEEQEDIDRAVHWVLGHSDVFLIPLRFQDGTNPRPVGQLPDC